MVWLSCGPWAGLLPGSAAEPIGGDRDVVVHGVSADRAASIAAGAVAVRRDIETLLFGTAVMRPWVPACSIHVHPDRRSFAHAVGGAPLIAGGATSIEFVGDTVSLRRIDIVDPADGGFPTTIAHELVHVVLADRFTAGPPPRWADEGLATLFDCPAKQAGHDADFRAAAAGGRTWRVADLMALDLDPADSARQRVFYGQSADLVRWLLGRADGPTFLRFLDDVGSRGASQALRSHYGIETVADLERAWRTDARPVQAGTLAGARQLGSSESSTPWR